MHSHSRKAMEASSAVWTRPVLFIALTGLAFSLLTGCGDDGSKPLSNSEVASVLPDKASLPGWREGVPPTVYPLKEAKSLGGVAAWCLGDTRACDGSKIIGVSDFGTPDNGTSTFLVTTFSSEAAAKDSFKSQVKAASKTFGDPQKFKVGEIGDDRDARIGVGPRFTKDSGAIVMVREGVMVLGVTVVAGKDGTVDKSLAQRLAGVITDRAHQVQSGEKATASL